MKKHIVGDNDKDDKNGSYNSNDNYDSCNKASMTMMKLQIMASNVCVKCSNTNTGTDGRLNMTYNSRRSFHRWKLS